MGRRVQGFTLLELIIAILIVGLLIAIGMSNMRRGIASAESQGLAQIVAEELRLARQTAMARQLPVAVGFPTNGGAVPHCQSVYNVVGEIRPKLTRVSNYAGDFPKAVIFSSIWPLGAGAYTTAPPALQTNNDQPPPWPAGNDPLLIFNPSGTATSNGMARFNGDFHLLVSEGIVYGATAAPPGGSTLAFFNASSVSAAYTITVTPLGNVSVTGGVLNNGGVTDVSNGAGPMPALPAPAPVVPGPSNVNPVIDRITLNPTPPTMAGGVDAVVANEDHVALQVEATDADPDDPLYCRWTSPSGHFSSVADDRMEWNPTAGTAGTGAWVSHWEFTPPTADAPGTAYTLTVQVFDRENGAIVGSTTATRTIHKSTSDEMVFSVDDRGDGNCELVALNAEGDGIRYLTHDIHNQTAPQVSPDGARIAYLYQDDSTDTDMEYHLRLLNGQGERNLSFTLGNVTAPCRPLGWCPDSREFAAMHYNGALPEIHLVNLDGSGTTRIDPANTTVGEYCPTFNPTNPDQMVYLHGDGTMWLWVRGSVPTQITLQDASAAPVLPAFDHNLAWSPDGTLIAFSGSLTNPAAPEIWTATLPVPPLAPPLTLTCTSVSAGVAYNPSFSPPGSPLRLVYDSVSGLFISDLIAIPPPALTANAADLLPAFTPGGDRVYFYRPGAGLCTVLTGGGAQLTVARGKAPAGQDTPPWPARAH